MAMLRTTKNIILGSFCAVAGLISLAAVLGVVVFDGDLRVVDEASNVFNDTLERVDVKGKTTSPKSFDNSPLPAGQIWHETEAVLYATADMDICVGGGLTELGELYWQTSNTDVIKGFYNTARTWLGYDSAVCKYPMIVGTGETIVTVGTYDGKRKDSIKIIVTDAPANEWKMEVLELVNEIRRDNNLPELAWGDTCAAAAELRAHELEINYSHIRPDGTDWHTACPAPLETDVQGENLAAGNAAVSPETTVAMWMGSLLHRENILNPAYTKLAVGFNFDMDSKYKTYWTQLFSTY